MTKTLHSRSLALALAVVLALVTSFTATSHAQSPLPERPFGEPLSVQKLSGGAFALHYALPEAVRAAAAGPTKSQLLPISTGVRETTPTFNGGSELHQFSPETVGAHNWWAVVANLSDQQVSKKLRFKLKDPAGARTTTSLTVKLPGRTMTTVVIPGIKFADPGIYELALRLRGARDLRTRVCSDC